MMKPGKNGAAGNGATRKPIRSLPGSEASEETRRKLLTAASEAFRRVGYQTTKLDHIADVAGFTKGALYWHFPSKQALFLALISHALKENAGTLAALLAEADKGPEALKEAVGRYVDRIDEAESLPSLGVELEIEARHNETFRALHKALVVQLESAVESFLHRYFAITGIAAPIPPRELSTIFITHFKAVALIRQNRPKSVGSHVLVRHLMGLPPAN